MKVLLLGITGSGKSTVSIPVAKALGLEVLESDQEIIRLNDGLWPKDRELITRYMLAAHEEALKRDNVLYVTSWLSKERIKQFHQAGFKIIELHASMEELLRRKMKRDNPDPDQIQVFKDGHDGYYEVVNDPEVQPLITLSFDSTDISSEAISESILKVLSNSKL